MQCMKDVPEQKEDTNLFTEALMHFHFSHLKSKQQQLPCPCSRSEMCRFNADV